MNLGQTLVRWCATAQSGETAESDECALAALRSVLRPCATLNASTTTTTTTTTHWSLYQWAVHMCTVETVPDDVREAANTVCKRVVIDVAGLVQTARRLDVLCALAEGGAVELLRVAVLSANEPLSRDSVLSMCPYAARGNTLAELLSMTGVFPNTDIVKAAYEAAVGRAGRVFSQLARAAGAACQSLATATFNVAVCRRDYVTAALVPAYLRGARASLHSTPCIIVVDDASLPHLVWCDASLSAEQRTAYLAMLQEFDQFNVVLHYANGGSLHTCLQRTREALHVSLDVSKDVDWRGGSVWMPRFSVDFTLPLIATAQMPMNECIARWDAASVLSRSMEGGGDVAVSRPIADLFKLVLVHGAVRCARFLVERWPELRAFTAFSGVALDDAMHGVVGTSADQLTRHFTQAMHAAMQPDVVEVVRNKRSAPPEKKKTKKRKA